MKLAFIFLTCLGGLQAATVGQTQLGSSAGEDTCTITKTATSFAASTRQVFFRFIAANVAAGDQLTVEWVTPAQRIHTSTAYDQLPAVRSLCLLTQLPVGGFPAAQNPGRWTVRVMNGTRELAAAGFVIESDEAAAGLVIQNVTVEANQLLIEGVGFNLESIVHVAQYTSSGGWSYIYNSFPKTLAADRLTVPLRDLKPAEYVVFVKNGQVLSAPARFLINTIGYRLPFPPGEQWVVSQLPYGGYSHWGRTLHAYDIAPRAGGCVVAMKGGIVSAHDMGFGQTPHQRIFGNYITIDHEDGEYSHYGHLRTRSFLVKTGERVESGQALATAGNSGYSFGTHVHVQVTKSKAISTQSIPFRFEEPVSRGVVVSANRSQYGSCTGAKPASPMYISTTMRQPEVSHTLAPTWSGRVGIANWWSDFTTVRATDKVLAVELDWDSDQRDLDLHLVSPTGRHYGSYGDRTGYHLAGTVESFEIANPEPGTWRVSVQGMKGNGEEMPFRIFRKN